MTMQKGKFRQTQLEKFLRKESFLSQILNKHRIDAQHVKIYNRFIISQRLNATQTLGKKDKYFMNAKLHLLAIKLFYHRIKRLVAWKSSNGRRILRNDRNRGKDGWLRRGVRFPCLGRWHHSFSLWHITSPWAKLLSGPAGCRAPLKGERVGPWPCGPLGTGKNPLPSSTPSQWQT